MWYSITIKTILAGYEQVGKECRMSWQPIFEAEQHRELLRQEAEQRRLVRIAAQSPQTQKVHRALAALGIRMIQWGEQLQRRHQAHEPAPQLHLARRVD
jgi:hypothetical protein